MTQFALVRQYSDDRKNQRDAKDDDPCIGDQQWQGQKASDPGAREDAHGNKHQAAMPPIVSLSAQRPPSQSTKRQDTDEVANEELVHIEKEWSAGTARDDDHYHASRETIMGILM